MSRHGSKEVGTGGKWVKIAIGIFVILAIFIMIYPKNSVPPQNYNSVIAEHGTLSVVVVGSPELCTPQGQQHQPSAYPLQG